MQKRELLPSLLVWVSGCTLIVDGELHDKPKAGALASDDAGDGTSDDGGSDLDGASASADAGRDPADGGNTASGPDAGGDGAPNAGFHITMGQEHGCVLAPSGKATCWGDNSDDQLGLPVDGVYRELSAGDYHTCAITEARALTCAGRNQRGQRVQAAGPFVHVAAGDAHTCVLDPTGVATCFGDDTEGQKTPPNGARFEAISAGTAVTCGIDATSHGLRCWGRNAAGLMAKASGLVLSALEAGPAGVCVVEKATATPQCWGTTYDITPPNTLGGVDDVSVGGFVCVLAKGVPTCWGSPSKPDPSSGPYLAVGVATDAVCAIPESGPLVCAGFPPAAKPPNYP